MVISAVFTIDFHGMTMKRHKQKVFRDWVPDQRLLNSRESQNTEPPYLRDVILQLALFLRQQGMDFSSRTSTS